MATKTKKAPVKGKKKTSGKAKTPPRVKVEVLATHLDGRRLTTGRPGVINTIVELLYTASEEKPITKAQVVDTLVERFPDRDVKRLKVTTGCQISYDLRTKRGLSVQHRPIGMRQWGYWLNPVDGECPMTTMQPKRWVGTKDTSTPTKSRKQRRTKQDETPSPLADSPPVPETPPEAIPETTPEVVEAPVPVKDKTRVKKQPVPKKKSRKGKKTGTVQVNGMAELDRVREERRAKQDKAMATVAETLPVGEEISEVIARLED